MWTDYAEYYRLWVTEPYIFQPIYSSQLHIQVTSRSHKGRETVLVAANEQNRNPSRYIAVAI